jgi:hypothetical protein
LAISPSNGDDATDLAGNSQSPKGAIIPSAANVPAATILPVNRLPITILQLRICASPNGWRQNARMADGFRKGKR